MLSRSRYLRHGCTLGERAVACYASQPAAMGKRKGYNWRARVGVVTDREKQNGDAPEDTNVLELPAKTRKLSAESKEGKLPMKKKLSSRQKKYLKRIVERKEKKAKVIESIREHVLMSRDVFIILQRAEILHQLATNAITESEINLLHSTTTIGRAKQTKK